MQVIRTRRQAQATVSRMGVHSNSDSFCNRIIKEFPSLTDLEPDLSICDNFKAEIMRKRSD